jgi:hypothetical protein
MGAARWFPRSATVHDDIRGAACAEFPNDNPALHRGAIWRCTEACDSASFEPPPGLRGGCEVRGAPRSRAPSELDGDEGEFGGDVEIVDELVFDGEFLEEGSAMAPPTATADAEDPFSVWMRRVTATVLAAGGTSDVVLGFSWLVGEDRRSLVGLPDGAVHALVDAGLVEHRANGVWRSERLARAVDAWKGILRGESEDFSACHGASLDEWTADVAARLLGTPGRAGGLRRDLRARGVAAFGLLDEAG